MRTTPILLLPLLAAACAPGDHSTPGWTYEGDLKDLGPAPSFHMLERAGVPVDAADMEGKVWTAAFIFTRCNSYCPMICRALAGLQEEFGSSKDFRMLCTTVDPAYDTVEILKAYAKSWEADPKTWLFATGRPEDIKALMGEDKGFKLGWQDEMVNHSRYIVLVDRQGRIRGYYDANDRERMKKLHADVRTLLAQQP